MAARSLFGRATSICAVAVCCSFWPSASTRSPVSVAATEERFSDWRCSPMSRKACTTAGSTALPAVYACSPGEAKARASAPSIHDLRCMHTSAPLRRWDAPA